MMAATTAALMVASRAGLKVVSWAARTAAWKGQQTAELMAASKAGLLAHYLAGKSVAYWAAMMVVTLEYY